MRKTLILLILMIFLAVGCTSRQPQIVVESERFDFGDITNGEVVSRDLVVWNQGNAPLVIEQVTTSCGCTKATLESMTIAPGEGSILHIEYDSGAHGPELVGHITRQVFMTTNDPARPEVLVEFDTNVLPVISP